MTAQITTGTASATFRYRVPPTHGCHLAPLYCQWDRYFGGTHEGHVAGYACVGEDEKCENAMVMLPDWGGCTEKEES